jgi:hypothetical protein
VWRMRWWWLRWFKWYMQGLLTYTHQVSLLERAVALPVGLLGEADALQDILPARLLVDDEEGRPERTLADLLPHLIVGAEVDAGAGRLLLRLGLLLGVWWSA